MAGWPGKNIFKCSDPLISYKTTGALAGLLESESAYVGMASNYSFKATHEYDIFGNEQVVTTEIPNVTYDQAGAMSVSGVLTRTTKKQFDAIGRYVDANLKTFDGTTFIKVDQVLSRAANGAPATLGSELNSLVTTLKYDDLGREIGRSSSTGAAQSITYYDCRTNSCPGLNIPSGAVIMVETAANDGSLSRSYSDKLARPIRKATQDFSGNGKMNVVDITYDAVGNVQKQSLPRPESSATADWQQTKYDILGRPISSTQPNGAAGLITSYEYKGPETKITNPKNQKKIETRNAIKELIKVTDNIGGTINYDYDAKGNLTTVTKIPAAGDTTASVITRLGYDDIVRKISMDDPDKGHWDYKYNALGDLLWQKDGKGQIIIQAFDKVGRMQSRDDYVSSTSSVAQHTRWYYGNPPKK